MRPGAPLLFTLPAPSFQPVDVNAVSSRFFGFQKLLVGTTEEGGDILIRAHGGMRTWGLSCGLLIVELLAAGAGSAVGIATYLSGKKY